MNRNNMFWNKIISDEEIYNKNFSIGYLLQSNTHIPLIAELKDKVLATYKVKAKFTYQGYNGEKLYCNGQLLINRKNKFKDFIIGEDVKLLEHNLCHKRGGSNNYPSIAFKDAYCILEFISYGLPYINKTNGWEINIIEINKIKL